MKTLLKYKIGLGVILLFTIGMMVYVLMQTSAVKQDTETTKTARSIANKLENYVNTQQSIPSNLSTVGVNNTPSTITYTKLSPTKYKFCVTYKASNSGFNASSAVQDVTTGYYSNRLQGGSYASKSYINISDNHKKGENCQTIEPILYGSFDDSQPNNSGDPYQSLCAGEYVQDFAQYCTNQPVVQ